VADLPDEVTQPTESSEARRSAAAAALINVKAEPVGFSVVAYRAMEAQAYHNLNPYPWWHFTEWNIEKRGPYPKAMPFGKSCVLRSARWLFGKPIKIKCADSPDLEKLLAHAWVQNRMRSRMRAAAELAGQQGGTVLKFSYDGTDKERKLRFQILSPVDECRLFYDAHDRECLLMARVQYPYRDPVTQKWMFYREEWTDAEFVRYKPVAAAMVQQRVNKFTYPTMMAMVQDGADTVNADEYAGWQPDSREANPFGLIPLQPIRNIDIDDAFGIGDMWGLYRVWDRVNLTYHGMDRSNQFDSEPNLIFLDVEVNPQDADKPLAPGQPGSYKSELDDEGKPLPTAEVKLLEAKGNLRPAMMEYAKDLRKQILVAASQVEIDQAEFSNKGNLTQAVLVQMYQLLIELTEEKRENYGANGICLFLEKCAIGLKNLTASPTVGKIPETAAVDPDKPETFDIQIDWPKYFELTEDELAAAVGRTQEEETAGYLTHDRAIVRIAKLEGVEDVEALQVELEEEAAEQAKRASATLTATDPSSAPPVGAAGNAAVSQAVQAAATQIQTLKSIGGKDSI
jgi:hypothetical protein